jgi:hypothetical protein
MEPTMDMFSRWGTTHEGLFTFPHSPKHLGLYEKFGFSARFLTPVMKKRIAMDAFAANSSTFGTFSEFASASERKEVLGELRELTGKIYEGLDLAEEIISTAELKLGDTVLVKDGSQVTGFAICHSGANTEGGSDNCYVKFGAVLPGSAARGRFRDLVLGVEAYASRHKISTVEAGVNLGRKDAYKEMTDLGFRSQFIGVAMQKPDEAGFNRPDTFAIDDWR